MKHECPEVKNKKFMKKSMEVTWEDSEESSSAEDQS